MRIMKGFVKITFWYWTVSVKAYRNFLISFSNVSINLARVAHWGVRKFGQIRLKFAVQVKTARRNTSENTKLKKKTFLGLESVF